MKSKIHRSVLSLGVAAILGACGNLQTPALGESSGSGEEKLASHGAMQRLTEQGMEALRAGRYQEAQQHFNGALRGSPTQAALHFLNGLAYFMEYRQGNAAAADMAESGFLLALEFDPSNWMAAYTLGVLYVDLHRYKEAQHRFGQAAQLQPDSATVQLALAGASYYSQDLPKALVAVREALRLTPRSPEVLRSAAMIFAASGLEPEARSYYQQWASLGGQPDGSQQFVQQRLQQWQRIHVKMDGASPAPAAPASPFAAAFPPAPPGPAPAAAAGGGPLARPMAPAWHDCQQTLVPDEPGGGAGGGFNNFNVGVGGLSNNFGFFGGGQVSADETMLAQVLPSPCSNRPLPRMAVVDVVMLRTEETMAHSQGVNLLDGLKMVLGGSRTREDTSGNSSGTSGNSNYNTVDRTVVRSIGLPVDGITYSLNIFNSADTHTEVIARPSLLVLDRTPANFFSGSVVSVALTGQYGGNLQEKPIGVALSVAPTFIDDESMLLSVRAARSFIEPEQAAQFSESITTSRNAVIANVMMRFGQTLILSGLREREIGMFKEGVPGLRDVPLVQNFFATRKDAAFNKQIIIIITPRKVQSFSEVAALGQAMHDKLVQQRRGELPAETLDREAQESLEAYKPNLVAVLGKLGDNRFYREFRTGDLPPRLYAPPMSLDRMLQDVKHALYW